ncbi:hypothetical protein JMJ77_0009992 [Colletotrichum scovillei]|uniref:Apple domain-containing protein n=1 Tax=Colletotrichum scovillei TaxID=1209932 RepID=A0A9P7U625_9PEZI|nr:hypothetical protein JMJ78_0001119 [Colletotrichum scovillei]KAG7040888.1 hypothetical protein JMJ77_0009992 [Colletotrichum scovillei]KAG7060932.1 hypothetical protein JMJ76_0010005 [Colletotrichum scovillei]
MQFTIATIIAFAAAAQAGPLAIRDVCNSAPSGPTTANVEPRSQPAAATADACQKLCEADSGCQSFVFGLPPSGTTPLCYLYAVPASQVPKQSNTNLMVFDKACTSVPTVAPTQTNTGANNGNTGSNTGTNTGNTNTGSNNNNNGEQPKKRANVCGAAPAGPATSSPTPLLSREDITTQDACLALCKQTTGCQAIEFGKPSANEPVQCRLFNVPASSLPAPTNGQTFVAFDIGC